MGPGTPEFGKKVNFFGPPLIELSIARSVIQSLNNASLLGNKTHYAIGLDKKQFMHEIKELSPLFTVTSKSSPFDTREKGTPIYSGWCAVFYSKQKLIAQDVGN